MGIRMMEDVVPQGVVAAVDLVTERALPEWHRWVVYGMTILGYAGGAMNWGGPFLKEVGKSSLPLTARQLSETVMGGVSRPVASNRLAFRPAQQVSGRSIGVPFPASGADLGIIVSST